MPYIDWGELLTEGLRNTPREVWYFFGQALGLLAIALTVKALIKKILKL